MNAKYPESDDAIRSLLRGLGLEQLEALCQLASGSNTNAQMADALDIYVDAVRKRLRLVRQKFPTDSYPRDLLRRLYFDFPEEFQIVRAGLRPALIDQGRREDASRASGPAASVLDFSSYIDEKTLGFVGRTFVFDAIDQFVRPYSRGYFFIRGDPGIGKTAVAARYADDEQSIHHFNIRSAGITRGETFLRNICAQLILRYRLPHTAISPDAAHDGGFLNQILSEVSNGLGDDERVVLVVDAVDEADEPRFGSNPLFLPEFLPPRIYFVVTTRKTGAKLRIDCDQQTLDLEQDMSGNVADIREYLEQESASPAIQAYIQRQGLDQQAFVEALAEKSQGNFMFLHYVVPSIAQGLYSNLELATLPVGLDNYYEDHWRRMRRQDEDAWLKYRLPVIMALTAAEGPVSLELIAKVAQLPDIPRVRAAIQDWREFLYETNVVIDGKPKRSYRLYHASFQDFLANKPEVRDLHDARNRLIDMLLDKGGLET